MLKIQRLKDAIDWVIRLQGAYAIFAAIVAGGAGTAVRAILNYHTHLPALWITPIWLLSAALVLLTLLFLASGIWRNGENPAFDFVISTIIWIYNAEKDMTVFYIGARILNRGGPSITLSWSATYKLGPTSEPMKPFYLVGPTVLTIGEERLTIENDDLLNVKTSEKAIERGGAVYGRLVFAVPGNRDAQIKSLQHQIEVCVHDYLSIPYTAIYVPSSVPSVGLIRHPHEKGEFIKKQEVEGENAKLLTTSKEQT
ncbi:hypothetical protein HNQ77_001400 [Silvibacterium bohemicum]|uniref:Uncharacterized protein n=1 Tax=Silvibacterium bohemicum TaxID=1577686 RepID=A0A841JQ43_9BACT|nr:hypothetical protein [Silvibacterium bohemicum]MBB6143456.1 hypothetical protein [Silvibacterium bohemicum]